MIVRKATEEDIPLIVELLKLSLGESLMPKSEAYWRWKHLDNPFGSSPVLLAFEGTILVGVRAFMRWNWTKNGKRIKAIRAVDTATHPRFQGKGIFKKLTLDLLGHSKSDGVDFVFNTPNDKSKAGYLKMGWVEAGNLPVRISLKRPMRIVKSRLQGKIGAEFIELEENLALKFDLLKSFEQFKGDIHANFDGFHTQLSIDYLHWRYKNIPVINYYGNAAKEGIVIFRLKQTLNGIELRIVECIGEINVIESLIMELYISVVFDYMTISAKYTYKLPGIIQIKSQKGPQVTIRELGSFDLNNLISFNNWNPSLGDLEVF